MSDFTTIKSPFFFVGTFFTETQAGTISHAQIFFFVVFQLLLSLTMVRNLMRYTSLVLIVLIFIVSGIYKLAVPSVGAALLAKSNFPRMLSWVGVTLSPPQYVSLIRATGAIFVSFSLFILLGVGRSFFSFLLAMSTIVITIAFYIDFDRIEDTSEENVQQILKNISIVGALLFVSGSGHRSRRYIDAKVANEENKKKRQ